MDNISLEKLASHIISNSIKMAMADKTWQRLGFKKRPKYGELFKRFRKEWKVSLDNKLMSELLIMYLSYGVKSYSEAFKSQDLMNEIKIQLHENYLGIGLWKSLDFDSNEAFLEYVNEGVDALLQKQNKDWSPFILQKIKVMDIPDDKVMSNLMVGLAKLTFSLPERKIKFD